MTTEERILARGRADALRRMLTLRFGTLPADAVERLDAITPEQFDRWSERLFTASTLDDVFGAS